MIATATQLEPLAVDADGAGRLVGVSGRTWRRMNAGGLVPRPVRLAGSVRWRVDELRRWVDAGAPSRSKWEESER